MGLFRRKTNTSEPASADGLNIPRVALDSENFWRRQSASGEYDDQEAALKVLRWVGRPLEHDDLIRLIIRGAPDEDYENYLLASDQGKAITRFKVAASILSLSMGDDSRFPIAKDNDTGLYRLREPGPQGLPLPGGRATHIAAGDGGFAAMADGSVFGWKTWSTPVSPSVQVGRVRGLAAVGDAGCAVTEEGTVVSLTTGKVLETLSDVTAISYSQGMAGLLAARGDGSVVKTGYAIPEPPTDLRDVVAVAAGASHCRLFVPAVGVGERLGMTRSG